MEGGGQQQVMHVEIRNNRASQVLVQSIESY